MDLDPAQHRLNHTLKKMNFSRRKTALQFLLLQELQMTHVQRDVCHLLPADAKHSTYPMRTCLFNVKPDECTPHKAA